MYKTTIVDIAGGAGFTDIPATMAARHAKITETNDQAGGAFAPGKLQVKEPASDGSFGSGFIEYGEADTIDIGNPIAEGNAFGTLVGLPMQNGGPAYAGGTTYAKDDVVVDGASAYVSLQDGNVGNTPASSPTFWTEVRNYRPGLVYAKIRRTDGSATKVMLTEIS